MNNSETKADMETKMEMEMAMAEEIWKRLPEKVMFHVLARLPIKSIMRFHAVCKGWKEFFQSLEFKQLLSTLAVHPSPAFVFIEYEDEPCEQSMAMKLMKIESGSKVFCLSLDFVPGPVSVVATCKGLLCGSGRLDEIIYIGNPLTRSWIKLPEAHELTWWDFIGLTFDSCTRSCTLIIGRQEYDDILMEIYNSKVNEWSQFQTSVDKLVRPVSEGIYSNGKFYWINGVDHDRERFVVVSFDLQERQWKKLKGPNKITSALIWDSQLTGSEGLLALVYEYETEFCIWNLVTDEVEETQWSAAITFDSKQEVGISMESGSKEIVVNGRGYISVVSPLKEIVAICCMEGKLLYKVNCSELEVNPFDSDSYVSVRAFDLNNISWP